MCDSYSAALDALRDNNKVRELTPVHAEESCLESERQATDGVGGASLHDAREDADQPRRLDV